MSRDRCRAGGSHWMRRIGASRTSPARFRAGIAERHEPSSSPAPDGGSYSVNSSAARCRTAHSAIAVPKVTSRSGNGSASGLSKRLHCLLGQHVEVGVIPLDQLDDQRFLRLEMVIEAPGKDPAGVGDLLERRAKARRGEQRGRGVQDLCSARPDDRNGIHSLKSTGSRPAVGVAGLWRVRSMTTGTSRSCVRAPVDG